MSSSSSPPPPLPPSKPQQQQQQLVDGQTFPYSADSSASSVNSSSNSNSNNKSGPSTSVPSNLLMTSTGSTTLEQYVQNFNSNNEDGERIIEVSPNGRYSKLNVVLGKGAYKVVYKAIDREEGYEVAWNCSQTTRAEFNELSHEIEILKRVRHPNIINFHDCWYNNVEFVFVTELMTSGTLREYIRKLQIPNMKIVKRWCRQILKGLSYLHSHNPCIIHRDIKCDNIFINGAYGEVKIGDMGTAKMKYGKKYTVIGTPEFMAPEMYEEKGYNEKVDVYAFGMCLLEMVTGEYPYSECTNAAQIYKKVTSGIRPDCINRVTDLEVVDLLDKCLCTENERWTVPEVLEHSFLSVEPEVVFLSANDTKTHLTLQVSFRGMDKLSVKFEFNAETDTADEVVREMIEENVLPQKYQTLITHEINRLLRDFNKPQQQQQQQSSQQSHLLSVEGQKEEKRAWRRSESTMKNELEEAKRLVQMANDRAVEAEKKAELSEVRARLAEEKHRGGAGADTMTPSLDTISTPITQHYPQTGEEAPPSVFKDYKNETPIEELIKEVAIANNRGADKAHDWLQRVKAQDIDTVGDLRDLHDEDWAILGLTVFASRALRNALYGKQQPRGISSPKGVNRSVVTTPPLNDTLDHHHHQGPPIGIGISSTTLNNQQ